MRLLWYNIQDPLDLQVNGFGFYRTVVDGVIPLKVQTKHIGGRSVSFPSVEFAITAPWEASDCTNEELVPVWANPTQFTFSPDTSPTACTSSNSWEIDPFQHAGNDDASGFRVTQPWELDFLDGYLAREFIQKHITWAFSSTMEDDALGSEVEYDNDVPLGNHLVASFQEHVFAAGDPNNPHYLYFSKRFRPESFPAENFIEIGTANDPLSSLVTIAGLMGVFSRDTKYRVSGNATTGFTTYEAFSHRGSRATKSVAPSDKGIIFVANDGIWLTNLIAQDSKISGKIESLFTGDTVSDEEPINQDAMDQVAGTFYKSKYYFVAPTGERTVPNRLFIYSFDSEEWAVYDIGGGSMVYEPDTDALVLGGDDGFVSILETGVTDDGTAISAEVRTKDFQGGSYNTNNLFLYLKIDCEVSDGVTLNTELYVDDELKHTITISSTDGRVNDLHGLPEGTFGTRWRTRMTFDDDKGETKLYGVAAVFIPLAAS